jgi:DNA processing protein
MMKSDELTWYKLLNVKGLGNKGLSILYKNFIQNDKKLDEIFYIEEIEFYKILPEFGKGKFSKVKYENFVELDFDNIYDSYNILKQKNISLITIDNEEYPESIKIKMNDNAPKILFCKGYKPLLKSKSAAIVGSRNTDDSILRGTEKLASSLANIGYNVVSGYAKGVDTSAHLGALKAEGTTTVTLSIGINQLSIKKEFKDMNWEKNTLFISQFMPNETWKSSNAMIRNKLVCALSSAVIVINSGPEKDEKGRLSGTFDAAKNSLKMNIPTFVLSPKIVDAKGNKDLINMGAKEFEKSEEIIEYLNNIYKYDNRQFKIAEQTNMFG